MANAEAWDLIVQRLTEQTEAGELIWQSADIHRDDVVGALYRAETKGRSIICYEYSFMSYSSEMDQYYPAYDVAIEFVDRHGKLEWRFPETPSRWELLEAIRYRASGANQFLKEFLGEQ